MEVGTVPCIARCSAVFQASAHWMSAPTTPTGMTANSVSRHCQISSGNRGWMRNYTWLRTNLYMTMCVVCPEQSRCFLNLLFFSFLNGATEIPYQVLIFPQKKKKICLLTATSQWMFNLRCVGFFCLFVLVWFLFLFVNPTLLSTTALFKNVNYQCKVIIVRIFQWWGLGSHKCSLWRKKKKNNLLLVGEGRKRKTKEMTSLK